LGLSVRIIKDKKVGFSFTTSMENAAVDLAVKSAFEIAGHMPEDEHSQLLQFNSFVYPNIDAHDRKGRKTPTKDKAEMAKHLESECLKNDKRIKGVRSASVSETVTEMTLLDSNSDPIHHQETLYTASITCRAEEGTDNQMGSDFDFSNYLESLNLAQVGKRAAHYALELLGAGSAPTMKCPAVFRNSVIAELIGFLSSSFSAEEITKGRSMLANKMGGKIFSEKVTLFDDGLYPGGMGTSPFDGEGYPSQKTLLVDHGTLKGTLFNSYYARKLGQESTGNATRSIKSPPSVGYTNLYIENGKLTYEQLFDGISKGILVTELMGVHTANPVTGDFSLGASGILIENGKLTRPVSGFAIAGNILDVFKNITDLANDLRFFGSVGSPTARIGEISVGGL
jgi:PmbA protein